MYVGRRHEEEDDTLLCLDIDLRVGRSVVISYLVFEFSIYGVLTTIISHIHISHGGFKACHDSLTLTILRLGDLYSLPLNLARLVTALTSRVLIRDDAMWLPDQSKKKTNPCALFVGTLILGAELTFKKSYHSEATMLKGSQYNMGNSWIYTPVNSLSLAQPLSDPRPGARHMAEETSR